MVAGLKRNQKTLDITKDMDSVMPVREAQAKGHCRLDCSF